MEGSGEKNCGGKVKKKCLDKMRGRKGWKGLVIQTCGQDVW